MPRHSSVRVKYNATNTLSVGTHAHAALFHGYLCSASGVLPSVSKFVVRVGADGTVGTASLAGITSAFDVARGIAEDGRVVRSQSAVALYNMQASGFERK